jgi:predicted phage tail protein
VSVQPLREVRLYGPLRARFGRSHWLAVESPAEAVRALCVLLEGFRDAVLGHRGPGYRVVVGEGTRAVGRTQGTLALRAEPLAPIRLVPVIQGGKRQGVGEIIAGSVLVAAGIVFQNPLLVQAGASLLLGGAIQLLSRQRLQSGSEAQREGSYVFNGPVNVGSPGGPVPLIIGRCIVGSVTISSGISTDDIPVPPPPADPPPPRPADEPPYFESYGP